MGQGGRHQYAKDGKGGRDLTSETANWPTPDTFNRKSRKAMTASIDNGRRSGGGNSSPPGLEQMAELFTGITPKEMEGADLPKSTRELAAKTWPTPFGFDHGNGPDGNEFSTAVRKTVATWPTPIAGDSIGARNSTAERGPNAKKQHAGNTLTDMIWQGYPHSPPDPKTETPGLESSQSDPTSPPRWPTPTSRDYKDGACADQDVPTNALLGRSAARWWTPNAMQGKNSGRLDEWGGKGNPFRGTEMGKAKLNPNFVDWMMGWPVGWTTAKTGFDARAMESWRSRLRWLLECLLGEQG